ncbi:MAG TPA: hypothetical protein VH210_01670 [Gaiellaceae bacterium]|jgi:hypothetical protein|nr:hypothetical protein [Gaiellaceae bacterium]
MAGLLLIAAAVATGLHEVNQAKGRADRDFALCGGATQAPDCVSKRRPVTITWTASSANGFRREYSVNVHTRPHVTVSLSGLSKTGVAPFQGLRTTEIRYRQGRVVAFVAPDGTSLEFPFSFSVHLAIVLGSAVVAFLLGLGSLAWGLTRVNRTPRA